MVLCGVMLVLVLVVYVSPKILTTSDNALLQ